MRPQRHDRLADRAMRLTTGGASRGGVGRALAARRGLSCFGQVPVVGGSADTKLRRYVSRGVSVVLHPPRCGDSLDPPKLGVVHSTHWLLRAVTNWPI